MLNAPSAPAPVGFDFSCLPAHAPVPLQAKLAVGDTDTLLEREADRVAEQVMHMPERQPAREHSAQHLGAAQRPTPPTRVRLQPASTGATGGFAAPPVVHDVLNARGQPLDTATRAFMEPRFGHDFSHVRVHADAKAAGAAAAIGARAFTHGSAIAFATPQPLAPTSASRMLLAHELAHVVQQQHAPGVVRRQPKSGHDGDGDQDAKMRLEAGLIAKLKPISRKTYAGPQKFPATAPLNKTGSRAAQQPHYSAEGRADALNLMLALSVEEKTFLTSVAGKLFLREYFPVPEGHALRLVEEDLEEDASRNAPKKEAGIGEMFKSAQEGQENWLQKKLGKNKISFGGKTNEFDAARNLTGDKTQIPVTELKGKIEVHFADGVKPVNAPEKSVEVSAGADTRTGKSNVELSYTKEQKNHFKNIFATKAGFTKDGGLESAEATAKLSWQDSPNRSYLGFGGIGYEGGADKQLSVAGGLGATNAKKAGVFGQLGASITQKSSAVNAGIGIVYKDTRLGIYYSPLSAAVWSLQVGFTIK